MEEVAIDNALSASNCYSDCITSRKITIPFSEVTKHASNGNIVKMIQTFIASQIENKCTSDGFVHPGRCKVLSHSSGMLQGSNVVFDVAYTCSVFLPCEGAILVCRVKTVTSAGILAGINGASTVNPVVVYVLREHHTVENESYFNSIKPDTVIRVKIVGHRFELNDPHVSAIGELLQPNQLPISSTLITNMKSKNRELKKDVKDDQARPDYEDLGHSIKKNKRMNEPGSNQHTDTDASDFYFEHQSSMASCGRHALNNLLQRNAFSFSTDVDEELDLSTPPEPLSTVNLHQLCLTMRARLSSKLKKNDMKKQILSEFECFDFENHSFSLLVSALSLFNHALEMPSNDKEFIAQTLLSLESVDWKMIVNENGSVRGGHWVAVIKNKGTPAVYYFNSLRDNVKIYRTTRDFVDQYILQDLSSNVQFAFVREVDTYINPLNQYH